MCKKHSVTPIDLTHGPWSGICFQGSAAVLPTSTCIYIYTYSCRLLFVAHDYTHIYIYVYKYPIAIEDNSYMDYLWIAYAMPCAGPGSMGLHMCGGHGAGGTPAGPGGRGLRGQTIGNQIDGPPNSNKVFIKYMYIYV